MQSTASAGVAARTLVAGAAAIPSHRVRPAASICRCCGGDDLAVFLSLGDLPLSDGFISEQQLVHEDPRYPLDVAFCPDCSFVQILETVPPDVLFAEDYPYFSSFTDTLLRHS